MKDSAELKPLSECVAGYPSDAPHWGDELLESDTGGLPGELRKHLVLALLSSRQPPLTGPGAVRDNILSGDVLPLSRKWRTYALDGRRRLDVRRQDAGVRTRSWVTRRVPTAAVLQEHLPLSDGGSYLIVYGGAVSVLSVSDTTGVSVADDVRALRASVPVCDVFGWSSISAGSTGGSSGVSWWSLAAGYAAEGLSSSAIDEVLLQRCGGSGWGGFVHEPAATRTTNATPLGELVPDWAASDPQWGDELLEADETSLSRTASLLRRHVRLAARTSGELTIATPAEARQRLADRHLSPKPAAWSVYVLDEARRRVMVPSKWGQTARRFVSEHLPDPSKLDEKLALPRRGRWLYVWGGSTKELVAQAPTLHLLLGDERVADICAWKGETFSSLRAHSTVTKDGVVQELLFPSGVSAANANNPSNKEG